MLMWLYLRDSDVLAYKHSVSNFTIDPLIKAIYIVSQTNNTVAEGWIENHERH